MVLHRIHFSKSKDTSGHFARRRIFFLEVNTAKLTRVEANSQELVLRIFIVHQIALEANHIPATQRRQQLDQNSRQRVNQREDWILGENQFNFIKMRYLSYFGIQVRHLESIVMYSTMMGVLRHEEQIRAGNCGSNTNNAAPQILSYDGCAYALGMRLHTIEALSKDKNEILMGNDWVRALTSSGSGLCQGLAGRLIMNISTVTEQSGALYIDYSDMIEKKLFLICQTILDDLWLASDPTELGLYPLEQFRHNQIPVQDLQDSEVFHTQRP